MVKGNMTEWQGLGLADRVQFDEGQDECGAR